MLWCGMVKRSLSFYLADWILGAATRSSSIIPLTISSSMSGRASSIWPISSFFMFISSLAALSALHRKEVDRKTHVKGKYLYHILWCATAEDRIQWYFNGIRSRHHLPLRYRSLLGSGTSPAESLNHEVNEWFRNMPEIYSVTLQLELRMNQFSKLISHNLAMYTPQLRQLN